MRENMEKLYPALKDIWKDGEGDYLDLTEQEVNDVKAMINRAYDRGCNHGATSSKKEN